MWVRLGLRDCQQIDAHSTNTFPNSHASEPKCLAYELTVRGTGTRIRYMLLILLAFIDRRPSNTNNTFEQHSDLAYNQDNGSVQPLKPFGEKEAARAPTDTQKRFVQYGSSHTENIQGKVQHLVHKRRLSPDLLHLVDIYSSIC